MIELHIDPPGGGRAASGKAFQHVGAGFAATKSINSFKVVN
jgi:hypothetical protein